MQSEFIACHAPRYRKKRLKQTEEDLKKAKKSDSPMEDPFKEDAEEDDDSMVSYSFGLEGYQEAVTGEASFNAGA